MKKFTFLKAFLKDKMVASVAPTSSFGVKKLCKNIDFSKKVVIIEYGPGTGAFTKFLLKNITSESKIIAIESNPDFADSLKKINDRRLSVFCDSAKNLKKVLNQSNAEKADYVISGIPFSLLDEELKIEIIKNTHEILRDDGKFLVYQASRQIEKYLKKYFKSVDSFFEPRNIPTLFIFKAIK